MILSFVLLAFAFLLALIAGLWPPSGTPYRPNFGWLSLAAYFLSLMTHNHP